MNFVAIDFETANEQRASACSIGLTTVTNGLFEKTVHYLIRPLELRFGQIQTQIHGICATDVVRAPTFADLWPSISPLLKDKLLIAHNAAFDMSVLRGSLQAASIDTPPAKFLCSLQVAKRAWPDFRSHKLNFLAESLGIDLQHHNAGSDSRAAASLVLLAAQSRGYRCPFELARGLSLSIGDLLR